jgi:carboxyl-terminal processing protease
VGGDPPQTMTSWFLKDGDKIMDIQTRSGSGGIVTAKGELRLPESYQLPIAIVLNGRGGSSPEVLALGLKENKRATIVGSKSRGCLGATNLVTLPDGTRLAVASQEFVGGVTGAKYNNVGIPPDVPADEATSVDVATKLLQDKIAGR